MKRSLRVACQQFAPVVGEVAENRARARALVREAFAAGAGLVVLPELCTSGYVFESAEEARALAQPAAGGALEEWALEATAAGGVVVGGFCELGDDGELYNSAAVVDGEGVLAVYRKTHLWDREKLVFCPGSAVPPVLDTRVGRLGVAVCYDTSFPELFRGLALAGAEIIAVPTNNPVFPRPSGQQPVEIVAVRAQAMFNRVFVATCDRCGCERGVEFLGASVITDELGWSRGEAELGEPGLVLADVDLTRARDKRWGERNDTFGDRRPELYETV